ncbi:MAG: hypothetical protein J6N15_11975 [Ruminiclostridium sp.]|nr:hypothetical protein [Ruminiclostridium sp.]
MIKKSELDAIKYVVGRLKLEGANHVISLYKLPIYQLSADSNIIREWTNVKDASTETGVSESEILLNITGVTTSDKGYLWATDNNALEEIKPFLFYGFNKITQKDYVFSKLTDAVTETGLRPEKIMALFFAPKNVDDWVIICMDTRIYRNMEV